MERLTERIGNMVINVKYATQHETAIHRLVTIEDILGEDYDLDRLREQVEKVWRGEWEDMREAYKDVPKRRCSRCKNVFIGLDTPFCEVCGAPMTDKAVDMVMERLEALRDE